MESPARVNLRECDNCKERATLCAALTDSDSIVIAHRFLCEQCAQAMFSMNIKQGSPLRKFLPPETREERLARTVNEVKARSGANEHTTAFERLEDESS